MIHNKINNRQCFIRSVHVVAYRQNKKNFRHEYLSQHVYISFLLNESLHHIHKQTLSLSLSSSVLPLRYLQSSTFSYIVHTFSWDRVYLPLYCWRMPLHWAAGLSYPGALLSQPTSVEMYPPMYVYNKKWYLLSLTRGISRFLECGSKKCMQCTDKSLTYSPTVNFSQ